METVYSIKTSLGLVVLSFINAKEWYNVDQKKQKKGKLISYLYIFYKL